MRADRVGPIDLAAERIDVDPIIGIKRSMYNGQNAQQFA
jgi:hypothetical protein